MKHKKVIDEIEKFIFLGNPLSKSVVEHIASCSECKKYYENALKFSNGLVKLRDVSSKVSESIDLDKGEFGSYISERVVKFLSLRIFMNSLKRILIGISMVILVFLSSFLGSFISNSYWSGKDRELANGSLVYDDRATYFSYSYQESTNYSSTYEYVSYYDGKEDYELEDYFDYTLLYQDDYYIISY